MKWGSDPVLIQSTTTPGKIKVRASVLFEGSQMPVSGELELTSSAPMYPLIFDKKEEALPKAIRNRSPWTRRVMLNWSWNAAVVN